jgi:hypothetical protein
MKNWKTIIMFVIFGLLSMAVIALIAFGRITHTEPDLQPVCWGETEGEACYRDCSCAEMDSIIWPQGMPLSVVVVDNDGSVFEEVPGPIASAMGDINTQLGARFLVSTHNRDSADIEVTFRAAYEMDADTGTLDGDPGYCKHWNDGRMRAYVAVRPGGDIRFEYRVAFHELGHALGLAHDSYQSSIMYEPVYDDRDDDRMAFTMFSEWDRRVLRQTYGFEE